MKKEVFLILFLAFFIIGCAEKTEEQIEKGKSSEQLSDDAELITTEGTYQGSDFKKLDIKYEKDGEEFTNYFDPQLRTALDWIKENVDSSYSKAVLEPWKATAFTAITGKYIYSRIGEYPTPTDMAAYNFLGGGCRDSSFMKNSGISIVYTREPVHNADLIEVRKYVYLLKQA